MTDIGINPHKGKYMAYSQLPSTYADIKTYITTKIQNKYPWLNAFLNNSLLGINIDLIE